METTTWVVALAVCTACSSVGAEFHTTGRAHPRLHKTTTQKNNDDSSQAYSTTPTSLNKEDDILQESSDTYLHENIHDNFLKDSILPSLGKVHDNFPKDYGDIHPSLQNVHDDFPQPSEDYRSHEQVHDDSLKVFTAVHPSLQKVFDKFAASSLANVNGDLARKSSEDCAEASASLSKSETQDLQSGRDPDMGLKVLRKFLLFLKCNGSEEFGSQQGHSDSGTVFVNLTAIRNFTGRERMMVGDSLDLSDLLINGDEVKAVIHRMSGYNPRHIDLSNNNISELPADTFTAVAQAVQRLQLSGNPLLGRSPHSSHAMITNLPFLKELNLSRCALTELTSLTPWASSQLVVIDMSNNNLTAVPPSLQVFPQLQKLVLDGNPILVITDTPFVTLRRLQVLSVNSCLVSSVTANPFKFMDHLVELSLDGNNLTRISAELLPHGSAVRSLSLGSNPWHCDCQLILFLQRHKSVIRDTGDIRCGSPRRFEGMTASSVAAQLSGADCALALQVCSLSRRLQLTALALFVLAVLLTLVQVLLTKRKFRRRIADDKDAIKYIRIEENGTKEPDKGITYCFKL